jgi:hypothetical protein
MREYLPVALAFVSALLFYLGSPGQQWRASPLWPRASRKAAVIAATGALFAGVESDRLATTLSVILTTQMACLVAFPFIGALRTRGRPAPVDAASRAASSRVLSPVAVLAKARAIAPGFEPEKITWRLEGQLGATVFVRGNDPRYLARSGGFVLMDVRPPDAYRRVAPTASGSTARVRSQQSPTPRTYAACPESGKRPSSMPSTPCSSRSRRLRGPSSCA